MVRPAWNAVYHLRAIDDSFKEARRFPVVGWQLGEDPVGYVIAEGGELLRADDPGVVEALRPDDHASFVNYEPAVDAIASFLDELVESAGEPKPWLLLELETGRTVTGQPTDAPWPGGIGIYELNDHTGRPVYVRADAIVTIRTFTEPPPTEPRR